MLKNAMPSGLSAKIVETLEDKVKVAQLRYQVYALEKGYISRNPFEMDMDPFDEFASAFFACFDDQNRIIGTMRLIQRPGRFMIDPGKEFLNVGGGIPIRTEADTCELSRLAVHKDYRDGWAVMLMYRDFVHYCQRKDLRFVYALKDVEETNKLRANFGPITRLKGPIEMPDGTAVELSVIDIIEVLAYCKNHNQRLYGFLMAKAQ